MENKSCCGGGGGGGAKPTTRFGFSWADEVEREEREQQQLATQQRLGEEEARRGQRKPDPFGAARPREVVLAEKGVDWRARDRELDLHAAPRPPPRSAARARRRASIAAAEAGTISASARGRATPARRGAQRDRDAGAAGRTPHPRDRAAESPPPTAGRGNAPPVSRGAWGGGKRKCAGEGAGSERRVRPAGGDHGRKIFGELNVGGGCAASPFSRSARKTCGPAETEGVKATVSAAADAGSTGGSRAPPATTAEGKSDGSGALPRRRGRKSGKGRGLKRTEDQRTQLL